MYTYLHMLSIRTYHTCIAVHYIHVHVQTRRTPRVVCLRAVSTPIHPEIRGSRDPDPVCILRSSKWAHFGSLGLSGVSVGVQIGVDLAIFGPPYTIPIRARAYNDCVQDAVLLKTASNQGYPWPQNGTHFGSLKMAHTDSVQFI